MTVTRTVIINILGKQFKPTKVLPDGYTETLTHTYPNPEGREITSPETVTVLDGNNLKVEGTGGSILIGGELINTLRFPHGEGEKFTTHNGFEVSYGWRGKEGK